MQKKAPCHDVIIRAVLWFRSGLFDPEDCDPKITQIYERLCYNQTKKMI